jgi:hypothetical protein
MVLPQAIYVGAIPFYSFEQPEWYKDFALPNIDGPYTCVSYSISISYANDDSDTS